MSSKPVLTPSPANVDMKFEIVVIPVSDIDRAKEFYLKLGWRLDADYAAPDNFFRVIQFTPPGSGCSVIFGKGVTASKPGSSQGLYLIVSDIEAARKELAERGLVHLRVTEQRISRTPDASMRSAEDHYQHGVAMMNHGRWDEAREHLGRARKMSPKADYIVYAMAALDCLTGEAEAAMENLKLAIELKPENRYHARNDEDFAFLQEDPRFTELLYPEKDGTAG